MDAQAIYGGADGLGFGVVVSIVGAGVALLVILLVVYVLNRKATTTTDTQSTAPAGPVLSGAAPAGKLEEITVMRTSSGGLLGMGFDTRLVITGMTAGSSADRAGLKVGDRVMTVNQTPVSTCHEAATTFTTAFNVSDALVLGVERGACSQFWGTSANEGPLAYYTRAGQLAAAQASGAVGAAPVEPSAPEASVPTEEMDASLAAYVESLKAYGSDDASLAAQIAAYVVAADARARDAPGGGAAASGEPFEETIRRAHALREAHATQVAAAVVDAVVDGAIEEAIEQEARGWPHALRSKVREALNTPKKPVLAVRSRLSQGLGGVQQGLVASLVGPSSTLAAPVEATKQLIGQAVGSPALLTRKLLQQGGAQGGTQGGMQGVPSRSARRGGDGISSDLASDLVGEIRLALTSTREATQRALSKTQQARAVYHDLGAPAARGRIVAIVHLPRLASSVWPTRLT